MNNILDVPAHFYENEPKSVKIYETAISQTEGIWSQPNPPFKTRPLVGSGADPGGSKGSMEPPFERTSLTRDTLIEQSNRDTLIEQSQ